MPLRLPSTDTLRITGAALEGLKRIYRSGFNYAKAGVMLLDIQPASAIQQELDLGGCALEQESRNTRLMGALDAIQERFGREAIRLGSSVAPPASKGLRSWQMKQTRRSPGYTTDWHGLVTAS